jgi:lactate dehydrogenase-like 2-hydroxyacid dehydrogenase
LFREVEIEPERRDRVDPNDRSADKTATFPDVELALIGVQQPFVLEELQRRFKLHSVYSEPDPFAALARVGSRVRGAVGHGMAGLTRRHLELMPNLEICAIHGVGLETSDLVAAREKGVVITTAPVLFDDVADLAIALALACCRQIPEAEKFVRKELWGPAKRFRLGRKFTGMRAGVVGLGRIGIEVARRLEGFKTTIGYADPVPRDVPYQHYPDALELARNSDVLFLCAAGGPKGSPPIIGREILEALGPRGIFVNISRGWIVDEVALIAALVEKRLGAAGLDVFFDEPRVPLALRELDNVVLTPHIASNTEETMRDMGACVVDNLVSWFSGRGALTPVK